MVDLLMLGIVPGTNIQINFADWLLGSVCILCVIFVVVLIRSRDLILPVIVNALHKLIRRTNIALRAHLSS